MLAISSQAQWRLMRWPGASRCLLVAPPGASASDLIELKRATIGVIGGEANPGS